METAPNARVRDDEGRVVAYDRVGDTLKIEYKNTVNEGGWLEFSPANLKVWLNGEPLQRCRHITLDIDRHATPTAKITFSLSEVEIDTDSLVALMALATQREAEKVGNGE